MTPFLRPLSAEGEERDGERSDARVSLPTIGVRKK